jgi:hypothetical protein
MVARMSHLPQRSASQPKTIKGEWIPRMKLNEQELRARFPRASENFIQANSDKNQGKATELERHPIHAPLAKVQVQDGTKRNFIVRYASRRHRLLDEDNTCSKYLTDLLRYAKILDADSPDQTKIEHEPQIKVKSDEAEVITITIEVYE